jgi:undecaprenyl diphosphate synthase
MALLIKFLESEQQELIENDIRLHVIGQIERLPEEVRQALRETIELTRKNSGLQLNLALSYGSRSELVRMVRKIARKSKNGQIDPDSIDAEIVAQHLYTKGIPDPDLLIRTSGEMRISNFLLWQIAYSEIHITPTYWPDFGRDEFYRILKDFQKRERRFGQV